MLDMIEIRKLLQDRHVQTVADETGLAYQTILDIKRGRVESPNYRVAKGLSDYLMNSDRLPSMLFAQYGGVTNG